MASGILTWVRFATIYLAKAAPTSIDIAPNEARSPACKARADNTPQSGDVWPGTGQEIPNTSTDNSVHLQCSSPSPPANCVPCEGNPGNDPSSFCGLDINTNWYEQVPNTCNTVEYHFNVSQMEIAPDGVERIGLVVNGQMPGPLIEANWGDWIVLHLTNNLPLNGTSIHFHGIRQNWTNEMDGVPSITQCPLPPGASQTYRFRADSYGTTWWHSHFNIQAYEGVFGPMIIHGPAQASYDEEQVVTLQDWSHFTVDSVYDGSQLASSNNRNSPTLDTGLINGMNVWRGVDGFGAQTGQRFEMNVGQGKTYRIRLVNAAIGATFKFSIDRHIFKVIAMDFVPIVPYETDVISINIGQRYDLLVTFDQAVDNYWMRSDNAQTCSTLRNPYDIRGIVRYEGAGEGLPTSQPYSYIDNCDDEPLDKLIPWVALDVGARTREIDENVLIEPNNGRPNLFKWTLSGTTFQSLWGQPSLYQIWENGTAPEYSGSLAIEVPRLGEWVYVIIETPIPVPHPIHLHGHDFYVLAQGLGPYDSSIPLNTKNPTRRDVATMPSRVGADGEQGGYVVLAFVTDNPGVWLLHCHIGWHIAMGFALQIVEALDEIAPTVQDSCSLQNTCSAWNQYANSNNIFAIPWDSGV